MRANAPKGGIRPLVRWIVAGLTLGCSILLVGCGSMTNIEIVLAPFISPEVIPSAGPNNIGEFMLLAAVENYTSATSPPLWLSVYAEYWPNCNASWCSQWPETYPPPQVTGPPASQIVCLSIGALGAGKSRAMTNFFPRCNKASCPGHVWIALYYDPLCQARVQGPDTGFHLNWAADGNLARQKISGF
jgi:hypothetical protein